MSDKPETGFTPPEDTFHDLIQAARAGSREAVGTLLEECRPYLLWLANHDLDPALRQKTGASDIVQETLLAAQEAVVDFRGQSRKEFLGWLREILTNDLKEVRRHYRDTQKRQLDREVSLEEQASRAPGPRELPDHGDSPGSEAALEEEAALLRAAMARLPIEYRQVILWRNWEQHSFEWIGARMNRSADAVRKLWTRAIARLQRELHAPQPPRTAEGGGRDVRGPDDEKIR